MPDEAPLQVLRGNLLLTLDEELHPNRQPLPLKTALNGLDQSHGRALVVAHPSGEPPSVGFGEGEGV